MEPARDTPALCLALELRAEDGSVAGAIFDERGAEHAFTGWLGLLTLLEAASERVQPEAA